MKAWLAVISAVLTSFPARADLVELITGEVLHGRVVDRAQPLVILEHPVLGRLEIPAASVKSIQLDGVPEPADPPSVVEIPPPQGGPLPPQVTVEEAVAAVPEEKKPNWTHRLELGLNAREGRTQDANIRAALVSTNRGDAHEYICDARYALSTARGDRTENKFTSGLRLVWPTPGSQLDYFADARYEFDEFNSWEHRLTAGGGLTIQVVDRKREQEDGTTLDILGLKLRVGGGLNREFGSQRDNLQPEGILGSDLVWQLSERQSMTGTVTLYPSFDQTGEYRVVNSLEWISKLDFLNGLSLKLGMADEYQSQVDPGADRNNLTIFASLLLDF